ncbi:MAG TPA: hypothetical protein VEQ59_18685 [Polyangiaceae bacterium]|nr:hypothetical protein [Polyangiaceae bacterium]
MPTKTDELEAPRAPSGLLTALRDVLFENTSSPRSKVSAIPSSLPAPDSAELEAARAALRQGLEEALGPGIREFALQIEALREVLPDAKQRERAALRVLSLKGLSAQALVLELEQALARLGAQNEAFGSKLASRRTSIEEQRARAVEMAEAETAQTEQAIARLQSELDAARAHRAELAARREQALRAADESSQRLSAKQRGFERALSELQGEYTDLQRQISNAETA